jgi:hypothetical protein
LPDGEKIRIAATSSIKLFNKLFLYQQPTYGTGLIETNYPQKLWISRGLTNVEGNGRSRLEVDLLFFAQDDSVTDSRYRTETYRKDGLKVPDSSSRTRVFDNSLA